MKKIGLIDVDGHNYPNLALMKLSAYHKSMGDTVEWYDIFGNYDVVYMSKVFTHTDDYQLAIPNAKRIVKGGTGYDVTSRLPEQAEKIVPDYSLYPYIDKKTAYGFLTRGCIRKCPWCVVPRKEGTIHPYQDIDELAVDGRTNIILMDNNILAAGEYGLQQLRKIADRRYRIDFNQAMDARLVTDEVAEVMARIRWISNRIRFGCDTTQQIHDCERAIALIDHHGFKGEYFFYTMIGGKSDFCESYERVMYWWNRDQKRRRESKRAFVPFAQPYLDFTSHKQNIPKWQQDMAQWANNHWFFTSDPFVNFKPRKNFLCVEYVNEYYNDPCPLHFPDYSMTYEQALASFKK